MTETQKALATLTVLEREALRRFIECGTLPRLSMISALMAKRVMRRSDYGYELVDGVGRWNVPPTEPIPPEEERPRKERKTWTRRAKTDSAGPLVHDANALLESLRHNERLHAAVLEAEEDQLG